MTEDEIEERSFRSLLPSEAHRRGTMEKKSRQLEESEDDGVNHNTSPLSGAHSILKVNHKHNELSYPKMCYLFQRVLNFSPLFFFMLSQDASIAFSGGQDSFSQFTMDMVRQYMKDEEVRLQHQSSLLRLRQKALKEKTRTELAWLEHQKKRLRDKGEDDKMPPIRKKQRGLLMKLQQEQVFDSGDIIALSVQYSLWYNVVLVFTYSPSAIMFPGWDQASSGSQQGSNEGKAAVAETAGGDWADEKHNTQTEGAS